MIFNNGVNDVGCDASSYTTWHSMLRRCYSDVYQKSKPTYIGTTIDKSWLLLSNFDAWFSDNYVEGWSLDKDLLSNFKKHYSKENCCFLPNEINCAIRFDTGKNGLPPGVSWKSSNSKYVAQYSRVDNGIRRSVHILLDNDPTRCFNAYKKVKEDYLKELAERHKDKLDNKAYKLLTTFQI